MQHNERPGRRTSQGAVSRIGTTLLRRGVWQAPYFAEEGEMVLIAVRRDGRLNEPPNTVPHGASRHTAAEALLERLDRDDPIPVLRIV